MNLFATVTSRPAHLSQMQSGAPVAASRRGFTLTEVVLAVGVLSLAIVALLGLFGPTMSSVKNVVDRGGAIAVADQLNSMLLSNQIYGELGMPVDESGLEVSNFETLGGEFYTGTGEIKPNGLVVYAWRERDSSEALALDKQGMKFSKTLPANAIDNLEGSVFVLKMKGSEVGDYDGKVKDHAYFPIIVSIYEMPAVGGNVTNVQKESALFEFTTAKLR